jgi:twitching motility protein PilT
MSSPTNAPPTIGGASSAAVAAPATTPAPIPTPALLTAMLRTSSKISDLFFSPGKPPMVEVNGRLAPTGPRALTADDTRRIAADLIGNNQHALDSLREQGSCDVSYSLPGASRFRVNIFMQRGSSAIVRA